MQVSSIEQAKEVLLQGGPVLFPTDTVYGVGVAVNFAQSPEVLYQLKERDRGKPIAWLVGGLSALDYFGEEIPELAYELARRYWPGALTLIVKASKNVPIAFQSEAATLGLRMPRNAVALGLIEAVGSPLCTTSANFAGEKDAGAFAALDSLFLERVGVVVADGVDADKSGVASTVVDCTKNPPVVVRQGAITQADLNELAGACTHKQ